MVTASKPPVVEAVDSLMNVLPVDQSWRSVAIVVRDDLNQTTRDLALRLAKRDATRVILYDLEASSGWTSPFPPEDNLRLFLLDEPGIRRSGRDAVADAVRDLRQEGVDASGYLSNSRYGADLNRLVATEEVDLVVSPVPLNGNLQRNVHLSRREGAHLLLCPSGQQPVLYPPLGAADEVPVEQRIQIRFLVGLLLTFLAAGLRNRAGS